VSLTRKPHPGSAAFGSLRAPSLRQPPDGAFRSEVHLQEELLHPLEYTIADAELELERRGLIETNDQLIILSDVLAGNDRFDSIQIRRVL